MGGTSSQQQTTQSQSNPWAPAQPLLQGILGQLGQINPQLTGPQSGAIAGLEGNANALQQYTPQVQGLASNLLSGGGANAQAGNIQSGLQSYQQGLAPYTSASYLDPRSTPGFSDAMSALNSDITNQVNGQFAGAGRDLSGLNQQALARGLSQGEGQLIANQYNQNVGTQQNALGSLYGAQNTTGGLLTGLNQQGLANQQVGVGGALTAQQFQNDPYNQTLAAEAQKTGIPLGILAQLTGMGGAIGGLGGQSSGTSNTTQQMSGVQQFATLLGGIGSLFGKK
jgi:hypothetical protein